MVSSAILEFYNATSEENRLTQGLGPLEFKRNKEIITQYLPEEQGVIIDVGGGTGKYAAWMAEKGHRVFMIDPVEKHIKKARYRSRLLKNPFHAQQGEARNLKHPR